MPLLPERVKAIDSGVLVRQFSAVFLILWSAFIIMRIPLLSHFRRIGGDSLDGMLALAIEMHWLHVLNGTALEWRTTDYFFPIADTLGYNESFFLHGTFLALVRFFGADFFLALQIVDWSFRAIGFLSMWALARRHFDWPNLVNLLAAALFVTANCYYPQATAHAQFLTCNLLPLLILLQIDSFRAVANGTFYRFVILAALFAGLMGAVLVTSYYVSFFFILVDGTVLALYVLLLRADSQLILPLPRLGRYAAAQLVLLVVFSIPFLLIYLPKAVETGMHPFSDVEPFALRPTDVINVGPYNLLWSHLYQRALGLLFPDWEGALYHQTGATPILFGLFLIGGWMLRRDRGSDWRQAILFAMWCSNLLLLGVTIRWSRFWPWAWIYRFVPGSQGVRVIPLIQLNLMIPTIIVACNFIAVIWKLPQIRMALVLIALLLLIEQVNDYPIFNIDRSSENAFLAKVNHVPPSCRVFFAQNSRLGPDISTLYRHNVDAMILAEVSGTPTINGYATFLPPRWMLVHPEEAQYLSEIHEWLASHAVTGPVCVVDFKTGSWTILSD